MNASRTTKRRGLRFWALLGLSVIGVVLLAAAGSVGVMAYGAAAEWTHPARSISQDTPAAYGLDYEDVVLETEDGLHLAAWYVPSKNGTALIMLHGRGGNRSGDLALAHDLAQAGYGLLLLDLRAHGESEGTVSSLGYNEVRDVRAATRYVQQRPGVDPERIGVYGASMGAAVAIMAAAELPELKAVVADSSYASVEWVVRNQFQKLDGVPPWLGPVVVAMGSWQIGVDASQIAPVQRVGRISPRPLLIVHGEQDEMFLLENAALLAAAAGEPKEIWIGPGVRHTQMYGTDPVAYVNRVSAFYDRALGEGDRRTALP